MRPTPIEVSRILAGEYGYELAPVNYIRGLAISGRLRLHGLAPGGEDPAPAIAKAMEPFLCEESLGEIIPANGAVQAGVVWAEDLAAATGEARYDQALARIADSYLETGESGLPAPIDPDDRVEEVFFAGALLGRAFGSTGDARYIETLAPLLQRWAAQADTGLWWHCRASPFYWGRGNAFAALGYAEGLSYLPAEHAVRGELEAKHRAHLEKLIEHQHESGAWHQVIDRPDSYLEMTATAMIGYALARGLARGWLGDEMREPTARAWDAVAERVDGSGMVRDACTGTGPLASLDEYVNRPADSGHDDRAGSMALWFGVEYAALLGAPGEAVTVARGEGRRQEHCPIRGSRSS